MLCLLGILLILVIIYLNTNRDLNQLTYALVVLVVLIGGTMIATPRQIPSNNMYRYREGFANFAPVNYNLGSCGGRMLTPEDSIARNRLSNWDGIRYTSTQDEPNRKHKWRNPPSNLPLIKDPIIYSPVGEGIPLTDDLVSSYYPSVDGDPNSPRRLFMFAHNQARPECCPSTYSTDMGCVCTTEQQRDLIANRGNNSSPNSEF